MTVHTAPRFSILIAIRMILPTAIIGQRPAGAKRIWAKPPSTNSIMNMRLDRLLCHTGARERDKDARGISGLRGEANAAGGAFEGGVGAAAFGRIASDGQSAQRSEYPRSPSQLLPRSPGVQTKLTAPRRHNLRPDHDGAGGFRHVRRRAGFDWPGAAG